jgi:hypothetical protein
MPLHMADVAARRRVVLQPMLCLAMLVGVGMLFSAPSAHTQSFSAPVDISGSVPGGLPVVAVDTNNNIDIAWGNGKGVFFTRSTDGGKNFTMPVAIGTGIGSGSLHMDVDRGGSIYLFWQESNMHFALSRSSDGGGSFSTPTDLSTALNMGTFAGSLPTMALDSSGGIDLAWAQYGTAGAVLFSHSTDGGGTFSVPVTLANFLYNARTQIATSSAGNIYILWTEETTQAGGICALRFNRSVDSGATFSATQTINTPDGECDARLEVDSAGQINVMSFDGSGTSYRSTDGGRTFLNSQNVLQPTSVWFGGQLNADSRGNVNTVVNSFPNHDILFSGSSDQGATFSKPLLVSASHPAPTPGSAFGGNNQSMAVDLSGNINVLWEDDILTPGAGDIFFSRSRDGGANFSTAQNISHLPGSGSPRMALDLGGAINVVWAASNANKVFFSRDSVSQGPSITMSVSSASLAALPGGSAMARVTVTAMGGFNQSVNLSCNNLPPGAQCSFAPASVTPTASGAIATMTVTIPATLPAGGFPFTVNAVTPTISQFLNMQITSGVVMGSVTPTAMTIPVGGTANFGVTVTGTSSFAGQFNLTCVAPAGVACTFSPSASFLPINGTVTSLLTVQILSVPATGSAPKSPRDVSPPTLPVAQNGLPILAVMLLFSAPAFAFLRTRESGRFASARRAASLVLTAAVAAAMLSCGGAVNRGSNLGPASNGSNLGPSGTTVGTGGLGVAGGSAGTGGTTSGGMSVTFPLAVQALSGGAVVNVGTVSITVP